MSVLVDDNPSLGRDLDRPKSATLTVPAECSSRLVSDSMNEDPPIMMLAGFRSRWMRQGCRLCMYAMPLANSSAISTCKPCHQPVRSSVPARGGALIAALSW